MARLPLIAVMGVLVACWLGRAWAAEADSSAAREIAAAERDACKKNLETIYKAILEYRKERQDLPNWLSSLVPKYISDVNVLLCPVCRRTGAIELPPLADPRIPSSYLFEFCPVPLGDLNPKDPTRTRREWKRRQMGLIGSVVPIVRCRHHQPALNVSFEGKIYDSPGAWEMSFTNLASFASLTASNLFAGDGPRTGKARFPARSPKATPRQIDLTKFYNAALGESWLGRTNENLASLPKGVQTIDGVAFDLRGLVQLAGKGLNKKYPSKISGVPVGVKCKRLHFLHALAGLNESDSGAPAGTYAVRFSGNEARLEIPLQCGRDVALWRQSFAETDAGLKPAWTGGGAGLFRTTWTNIAPDTVIESLEIVSDQTRGGLFVVAITAE